MHKINCYYRIFPSHFVYFLKRSYCFWFIRAVELILVLTCLWGFADWAVIFTIWDNQCKREAKKTCVWIIK